MITPWPQKKNKRAAYLAACILSVLSMLVSACGGILKTPEPVTIHFGTYEEFPSSVSLEELQKEFNAKQSSITVELVTYSFDGAGSTSNKFDCYATAGSTIAYSQVQGGTSLPAAPLSLDGFIEGDANFDLQDFFPGPLRLVTMQGSIKALPAGMTPAVMYYNKDLFDQHGLEYPQPDWTWDDFLKAAIAIRDPENEVWGFIPRMGMLDIILFIFQHGGNIVDDLENPTTITFTDPLTIEALEWYADLIHTYQVTPTREVSGAEQYYDSEKLIREGKAGMWTGLFFERLDISAEFMDRSASQGPDFPFLAGMAPLPKDAFPATYSDMQVYVISEETEQADACWQWITYLSDQMLRDYRFIPPRKSLVDSQEFEQSVGREAAQAARAGLQDAILVSGEVFLQLRDVGEYFGEAITKIETGEWTAQEAMEWVQEQVEK